MISDRLFVYGTLMRGFDHPMAQLLSRSADFLGEATLPRPALSGQALSGAGAVGRSPTTSCSANSIACATRDALLGEFDMYEACGEGFPEPTEYLRQMLPVTLDDGTASEAWTYVYNWPVTGLPRIASGGFWSSEFFPSCPGMPHPRPSQEYSFEDDGSPGQARQCTSHTASSRSRSSRISTSRST